MGHAARGLFEEKNNSRYRPTSALEHECTRVAGVAFFDERDAANGVEGASLIFQLYTIASSGVSFWKHQRHFAHRQATTVSARSSAPSRPLRDYARLIEGNAPITAPFPIRKLSA